MKKSIILNEILDEISATEKLIEEYNYCPDFNELPPSIAKELELKVIKETYYKKGLEFIFQAIKKQK